MTVTTHKLKSGTARCKFKCQGDHGRCRANYRCCLPALAGFVSPQSMGPGSRESGAPTIRLQGETSDSPIPPQIPPLFFLFLLRLKARPARTVFALDYHSSTPPPDYFEESRINQLRAVLGPQGGISVKITATTQCIAFSGRLRPAAVSKGNLYRVQTERADFQNLIEVIGGRDTSYG